jgi:hypothetical protein
MPLPTIAGVPYVHTVRYLKGFEPDGVPFYQAEFTIDDYGDSDTFANTLVGVGQVESHRYPYATNFIATPPVAIEGLGKPIPNADGKPQYDGGARITVTYRPAFRFGVTDAAAPPGAGNEQIFDPTAQPVLWMTEEVSFDSEIGTVPDASFLWEDDSSVAKVPLKYEISLTTMILTLHRVRAIPMGLIRSCRGKVNGPGPEITSTSLILPDNPSGVFLGASRGTVLFKGPKTTRNFGTDGDVERRLQLTFVEREQPWGKYLKNSKFQWVYLKDSDGNRQFQEADFRPLLYYAMLV